MKFEAILAVCLVSLTGCQTTGLFEQDTWMTMAQMQGEGRYGASIEYFDSRETYESADLFAVMKLCDAYIEFADYRSTRECHDQFSAKLEKRRADPGDPMNDTAGEKAAKFAASLILPIDEDMNDEPYDRWKLRLLMREARLAIQLGRPQLAVDLMDEAYVLFERLPPGVGMETERFGLDAIAGLANALAGHRDRAEFYAARVDAYKMQFLGMNMFDMSEDRNRVMSQIYLALGDYEKAKQVIQRNRQDSTLAFNALETALSVGSIASVAAGGTAVELAFAAAGAAELAGFEVTYDEEAWKTTQKLYKSFLSSKLAFETGDIATARAGYDAWLANPITRNFATLQFVVLHDRGRIALRDGDAAMAFDLFKRSIDVIEAQRSTVVTEAGRIGFVGDKQQVYADMIKLLIDQGKVAEAFVYAERGKARALIDLLASKQQFSGDRFGSDANRLLAKLDRAEQTEAVITPAKVADQQAGLHEIETVAKQGIEKLSPELASLVSVEQPDVARIQALLRRDETLLEFYGAGDSLFVFILERHSVKVVTLDGRGLAALIGEFRSNLRVRIPNFHREAGRRLYDRLFLPITHALQAKRLTIVPHGQLHYVPFAALSDGSGYLLDRYTIRVLPSASVLEYLPRSNRRGRGDLLVFGNPNLNDPDLDLPGAQREADAISEGRGAEVLLRDRATETAAKKLSSNYRYLHFATHGVFDAGQPLQSALLLRADSHNDGTLTVSELYDLTLSADLVTLSGCDTALGETANGDDVMGFTRGLLFAGSRSIVSSLWPVDDKATSELMQRFYRNMKQQPPAEALRQAQRWIKSRYNEHPFYWAAFQLTGAWE